MAITQKIDQHLFPNERIALVRFNKAIARQMIDDFVTIPRAREKALEGLGGGIYDLARAFIHLWPHWFLNGRKELAFGTEKECSQICIEILDKLEAGGGVTRFAYIEELFAMSGMSILTGNRPLSPALDPNEIKRPRKYVNTQCRFHSNKKAVSRGLCIRCYSRWDALSKRGVYLDIFPEAALIEVMAIEPKKGKRLAPLALAIKERYAENS